MRVKDLTKQYDGKTVVDSVSFEIPKGKVISMIGPNGAGKSTVLNIISRLIARDSGLVDFAGRDIAQWKSKELAKRLAILTQSNHIEMKLTVRELVTFGRFPYSGSRVTQEDQAIIDQAIAYMKLEDFQDRFLDELSGGQRQRAMIAMVIAQDTEYVLLDEPTNNLDLDAIAFNMESMRKNIDQKTGMIGVIKTDAYGHGSVPVAEAIEDYVDGYAVATADEAVLLRRNDIKKMILILGVTHPSRYQELIEEEIRPTIFTMEQAKPLSDMAVRLKKTAKIHLALDTGMRRIGMEVDEAGADLAAAINSLPGIEIEGLFTHFSRADEKEKTSAMSQLGRYLHFVELLKERGIEIPMKHCSNSAGIIRVPEANLNAVRAGITIYGIYPSNEVERDIVKLIPAMELKSHISYIKTVEPGAAFSYGGTFTAKKEMKVATIPVGYADGYPRSLSNKGWVLIHGKKAPILGRVCMDQFMVDITKIPDAKAGDEVTLIGKDGKEFISIEKFGDLSGRFSYEFACDISKRVPRVYIKDGKEWGELTFFN